MKKTSFTLLLALLLSMVGINSYADFDTSPIVQVGTLTYRLDNSNNTAQVAGTGGNYLGDKTIPSNINYNNKQYSVTSIRDWAFERCSDLTSITIPNSVTNIGCGAFYDCDELTSATIGNSVTRIGGDAFIGCSGLKKVIVSDIAAWCAISFDDSDANPLIYAHHLYSNENTEIKNLIIPNSVTSISDYAFKCCSYLTSVTIPNSVTSIGSEAFENCSSLTTVTIPNSVTSIGSSAFAGCSSLTSITIGNSVTSIGYYSFSECSNLTSVTVLNPTPVAIINWYIFCGSQRKATLYVPKGSKSAYQAADYWKDFKEIIEIDVSGIDEISIQENGFGNIKQEGAVWYNIDSKRASEPQRGINIIRMKDGTTRKVVVK